MTNNKTPLQKAYDGIIGLSGATYDDTEHANQEYAAELIHHMSTILEALKAAQKYADLPEKIEGMRIDIPDGLLHDTCIDINAVKVQQQTIDSILNLLKEEV